MSGSKSKYGEMVSAIINGRLGTVRSLLDRGADINEKDENGITPLMWATCANERMIVRLLIERGADIHQKNKYLYNALILAVSDNQVEIVSLLLEKGARLDERGEDGLTALEQAEKRNYTTIVNMLKEAAVARTEKRALALRAATVLQRDLHRKKSPFRIKGRSS